MGSALTRAGFDAGLLSTSKARVKGGHTYPDLVVQQYEYYKVGNRQTLETLDGLDSQDYDYYYNGLGGWHGRLSAMNIDSSAIMADKRP